MKNKKKNRDRSFLGNNKLLIATLSGVAAGISLASLLGTDKAKKIVDTVSSAIPDIASKLKNTVFGNEGANESQESEVKSRRTNRAEKESV